MLFVLRMLWISLSYYIRVQHLGCLPKQFARQNVRSYLGVFLFSGDSVDKKVDIAQWGRKNRLAMVKILLQDANFLMLDEPTNHLDIQALKYF